MKCQICHYHGYRQCVYLGQHSPLGFQWMRDPEDTKPIPIIPDPDELDQEGKISDEEWESLVRGAFGT